MANYCRHIDKETFKRWLHEKQIRGASLEDMLGTHHSRPVYSHPVTGQPFVSLPDTEAAAYKRRA